MKYLSRRVQGADGPRGEGAHGSGVRRGRRRRVRLVLPPPAASLDMSELAELVRMALAGAPRRRLLRRVDVPVAGVEEGERGQPPAAAAAAAGGGLDGA